ncbi:Fur family transcriptional regulator [Candidatus Enterococcus leclercqii]|uniref:Fur family transcriptional regulator n=1 Tax=Candidatus Enterococcus leclercqii TaxID=1857218 RepID=UPI00137B535D|nr:Fur family transcriptional regulator [Enterococcus sp. CU9D]KAF1292172.1 transcriptional repressor [Enterococcus sp. CU9D]
MEHLTVEEAIQHLKEDNVRITPQRYAIMEYLANHKSHPTADEIYQEMAGRFSGMSVATVYNNLRLLVDKGLVIEMKYGDASSRFDFTNKPHYHAICKNCGRIEDFYYPGLEDVEMAAGQLTGYEITEHRLEVYGLCSDCQKLEGFVDESHSNS